MKTKLVLVLLSIVGYVFFHATCLYTQCNNVTSFRQGTVTGQNTTVGSLAWTTPNYALVSDNNYATEGVLLGVLAAADTYYLTVQGFNFSVPLTANICGIEATIEHRALGILIGSNVNDNAVRMIKNGVITGANLGSGSTWFSSNQVATYGGNGVTWGTTWTVSDINSSNFGIAISAHLSAGLASLFLTAQVDAVTVGVHYENPLPVELMTFDVNSAENREISLKWSTASETNNDYFVLERSADAIQWEDITHIDGMGNNNTLVEYEYNDQAPLIEGGYYRLSQIDFDGSRYELGVRYAQYLAPDEIEVGYDPAQKEIRIYTNQALEELSVDIFDMKGTAVKTLAYKNTDAIIHIPADDLYSQMYVLVLDVKGNRVVKKMMVY